MKRIICLGIILILCFVCQTTIFPHFTLAGISPNILLIFVVSFAFMQGKKEGMLLGFFCGLLIDIFFNSVIGINAALYMYIGYLAGYFNAIYYSEIIILPIILITGFDLLYNLVIYIFCFLLRNKLSLVFYIRKLFIPEAVYTMLIGIILYMIFHKINSYLTVKEEGSVE